MRSSCELEASDQDSQYAPTPGYFVTHLSRDAGLVLSPSDLADLSQRNMESPRLLQLSEWNEEIQNDELPGSCIRYMIEWKVILNRKVISRDTEEDVALTPSAYWPVILWPKLEKLLVGKTSRAGRVRSDDTLIVVSVNDRFQRDLTKRFDNLDIDWTAMEKQLLRWGELYCRGKKLRLSITFKYVEANHLTGKADSKDSDDHTPLWTVWNGHEAVVKLLHETGIF
ncbi:unnamed protein product [Penicillium pancosmium]